MVSSDPHSQQVEKKANCRALDKVMKKLGIKTTELCGKDLKHVMHCNLEGIPIDGGKVSWLVAFRGYALKLNLVIDNIFRQPMKSWKQ